MAGTSNGWSRSATISTESDAPLARRLTGLPCHPTAAMPPGSGLQPQRSSLRMVTLKAPVRRMSSIPESSVPNFTRPLE